MLETLKGIWHLPGLRKAVLFGLVATGLGCRSEKEVPYLLVGTFERDRLELIAEAQEPIVEIAVREGDRVAAGDLLVRLDPRRLAAEVARLEAERERGNLELLITTPIRTSELMAGKLLPYVVIGMIQTTVILLVGRGLFHVPVRGTLTDLYLAALVFVVASLSLGLVISTAAKTQFQAFQLTFFTFLPQLLLSGFMFPFDAMPRAAQWVGEVLPLTHFLRLVRGVLLRGAALGELQRDIWPLLIFATVMLGAAMVRFRKRLD